LWSGILREKKMEPKGEKGGRCRVGISARSNAKLNLNCPGRKKNRGKKETT